MTHSHASATHVGHQRSYQEDEVFEDPERGLFAVFDGMGGHYTGIHAIHRAIETLQAYPLDTPTCLRDLQDLCVSITQAIEDYIEEHNNFRGMGTTIAMTWIDEDMVWVAWCGDSRVYAWREGQLTRLSLDHTLPTHYSRISNIDTENAQSYHNVITRCLGAMKTNASVTGWHLKPGDRLLLCSDGVHKCVDDITLNAALGAGHDPEVTTQEILSEVLQTQALDNISLIVLDPDVRPRTLSSAPLTWGSLRASLHSPTEDIWREHLLLLDELRRSKSPDYLHTRTYTEGLLRTWPKGVARRPLETWLFHGEAPHPLMALCDTLWVPEGVMLTSSDLARLLHPNVARVDLPHLALGRHDLERLLTRKTPWTSFEVDTTDFLPGAFQDLLNLDLSPWASDWLRERLIAAEARAAETAA